MKTIYVEWISVRLKFTADGLVSPRRSTVPVELSQFGVSCQSKLVRWTTTKRADLTSLETNRSTHWRPRHSGRTLPGTTKTRQIITTIVVL